MDQSLLYVTWQSFIELTPSKESVERVEKAISELNLRLDRDRSTRKALAASLLANAVNVALVVATYAHR